MTSRGYSATGPGTTETFGGWGPAPQEPDDPRRQRGPKRRFPVAAAALTVGVLVCTGVAAALLLSLGSSNRHGSRRPAADPTAVRRSVSQLSAIVAQSATDRSRVIAAIDGVQNCSLTPASGESAIESVVADRRTSVSRLEAIAASRIPTTAPVANGLTTTLDAAISDDLSYMSWMSDVADGHATCGGNPLSDPNFAAAQAQSSRTNSDKQGFVAMWNPLASQYGEPTYRAEDF